MAEVVWRARAVRHLTQIVDYIRDRNPPAAVRYLAELKQACESLGEFPEKAPRYDARYRALVFRNHVVFYEYVAASEKVLITAVIDARRDVATVMRKLDDRSPH